MAGATEPLGAHVGLSVERGAHTGPTVALRSVVPPWAALSLPG